MDEATSALDIDTEERVLKNIMKKEKGRTCVVTTHRPSVLSVSDHIYEIREIQEEEVTNEKLLAAVNEAFDNKEKYIAAMNKSQLNNSIEKIVGLINSAAK